MTREIIVAAAAAFLTLGVGGALTTIGPWYYSLRKPAWNPPNWLFGPAWSVIGVLAAWAGVLAWNAGARTPRRICAIATSVWRQYRSQHFVEPAVLQAPAARLGA